MMQSYLKPIPGWSDENAEPISITITDAGNVRIHEVPSDRYSALIVLHHDQALALRDLLNIHLAE